MKCLIRSYRLTVVFLIVMGLLFSSTTPVDAGPHGRGLGKGGQQKRGGKGHDNKVRKGHDHKVRKAHDHKVRKDHDHEVRKSNEE